MTHEEIEQIVADVVTKIAPEIISKAVREELADVGIRIHNEESVDEARKDFTFLRNLRLGVSGTASKIGWLVIAAIFSGILFLFNLGFRAYVGP